MSIRRDRLPQLAGMIVALAVAGPMGVTATDAHADDVRPVTVDISEKTPGSYLVQWRVPRVMSPSSMPGPVLPITCRADSRVRTEELAAAWINRQSYKCDDSLAGQQVGIAFPVLNVAMSTLVRVELLSGERYSHMLLPGENFWRVPDADAGGFRRFARGARQAVTAGARHALHPAHLALLLAVCLIGAAQSLRLAGVFAAGQVVAVVASTVSGLQVSSGLAEVAVAVAAGILARQALLPPRERRQLLALAAAAGIIHGLGLANILPPPDGYSFAGAGWSLMGVLGMDAVFVVFVMALPAAAGALVGAAPPAHAHTTSVYSVAIAAFAIAMVPPTAEKVDVGGSRGLRLSGLPVPVAAVALGGSGRVAAQFPDAAVQTFVAIDAFEVRHETLIRIADFTDVAGVEADGDIAVEAQAAIKQRIAEHVAGQGVLSIDGQILPPAHGRVDFLGVDAQGALPRLMPVVEPVAEALIGVTRVYLLPTTPSRVTLNWTGFEETAEIPATVTDPEASVSVVLTAASPALRWNNELAEDPIPVVTATAVEPGTLWVPVFSLGFLGAALALGFGAVRRRRSQHGLALVRVTLAAALAVAPLGNVAVATPAAFATTPDAASTKRILSGVLPNIYRAFEYRNEEAAFDRLALSVTGDALTEVYLEHQRALEMEERGGARARVESFEVTDVYSVEAEDDGFTAEASWTVGGTVVHFGHRHFRLNRYRARVVVVPDEGSWKIRSIAVLNEERVR